MECRKKNAISLSRNDGEHPVVSTLHCMTLLLWCAGSKNVTETAGGQKWRSAKLGCQMVCYFYS